jgi:predicted ATP-binding protein involved in virulence
MSKIRIKNFGPIKEGFLENDGWMEIDKVTVFIGNQGSGKSTVAKVISTLTWLEKAINRGDEECDGISHESFLRFFDFQRIKSYFRDDTEIEYIGDRMTLKFRKKDSPIPKIEFQKNSPYNVPKVMYVPSERNFLSVVKNAYGITNLPETLATFGEEMRKGQLKLSSESLPLPVGELSYKYNKSNDSSFLIGTDYEVNLLESSSGFQSLVPLYLVTKSLSDELKDGTEHLSITHKLRRDEEIQSVVSDNSISAIDLSIRIEEIGAKYKNTCIINIVEEPEQNLFPTSQWEILKSLLKYNNINESNELIITTHSPYIINYLGLTVEADRLKSKIKTEELKNRLNGIVPLDATLNSNELVIYELDEKDGTIKLLGKYQGLPADDNYLNENLAYSNDLYSELLDIEDLC